MSTNVGAEIGVLKRRVSEIEGSFGFLTQQVRSVHRDLLAFQTKTEQRFDQISGKIDQVDGGLRSLRTGMPRIVSSAMREVLGPKPRKK